MYNTIYPVNINYRKYNPYQKDSGSDFANKDNTSFQSQQKNDNYIPASNKINISQILMDFKNTILAINAPKDVQDDVNDYLNLVDKESKKENPSREIIISNLKNASKISDSYITSALGKPSNVVEGWISTIFRQDINLKSNPDDINPDFLLKFPSGSQGKITPISDEQITKTDELKTQENLSLKTEEIDESPREELKVVQLSDFDKTDFESVIDVEASIDSAQDGENIFINSQQEPPKEKTAFSPNGDSDEKAKVLYMQAKKASGSYSDSKDALNMLNEALGYLTDDSNSNIRAAIHFERAKIFDEYDYVDYALRDYFEATKAQDLNLKANAYYKSGSLYDEFNEFDPALSNYLSSVAYSGEADNLSAQSMVLSKISGMYAKVYDVENAHDYADLAIDSALDSNNSDAIANTYSSIAQNLQYLGDSQGALNHYKNALEVFSRDTESYEQMAYNYSQASIVMRNLGNEAKAEKLQARANQYYQKAQLQQEQLAQAS